MKEKDIIYEAGSYWVGKHPAGGWTIYKVGVTHSTSTDTFTQDRDGLSIAIKLCSYRAGVKLSSVEALALANKYYKT